MNEAFSSIEKKISCHESQKSPSCPSSLNIIWVEPGGTSTVKNVHVLDSFVLTSIYGYLFHIILNSLIKHKGYDGWYFLIMLEARLCLIEKKSSMVTNVCMMILLIRGACHIQNKQLMRNSVITYFSKWISTLSNRCSFKLKDKNLWYTFSQKTSHNDLTV